MPRYQSDASALEPVLRTILSALCKEPDGIRITYEDDGHTGIFYLTVNQCDYGRCVGKAGILIWSLNAIMFYAGMARHQRRVVVRLMGESDLTKKAQMPFRPDKKWDRKKI